MAYTNTDGNYVSISVLERWGFHRTTSTLDEMLIGSKIRLLGVGACIDVEASNRARKEYMVNHLPPVITFSEGRFYRVFDRSNEGLIEVRYIRIIPNRLEHLDEFEMIPSATAVRILRLSEDAAKAIDNGRLREENGSVNLSDLNRFLDELKATKS